MTLRDLLEDQLISQAELAERMGVSKGSVSRWVAGERRPRMAQIRTMIRILNLPKEMVLAAIKETFAQRESDVVSS